MCQSLTRLIEDTRGEIIRIYITRELLFLRKKSRFFLVFFFSFFFWLSVCTTCLRVIVFSHITIEHKEDLY